MADAAPPAGAPRGAPHRLVDGFDRIRDLHFEQGHDLRDTPRDGQRPEVMVIACSDSRAEPAIIDGVKPGRLFVIRNAAAGQRPYRARSMQNATTSASARRSAVSGKVARAASAWSP